MSNSPSVNEMMAAYAEDAVALARGEFGIELDYSETSVHQVEEMLAKLHEELVPSGFWARMFKLGPRPDQIDSVSKMFGGYIGEVFKRHYGGEWVLDETSFPGETVYSFHTGGQTIWPHFKSGKRLINGPEDNVWTYYQIIVHGIKFPGEPLDEADDKPESSPPPAE